MNSRDTLRNILIAASVFFAVMWIAPKLLTPPAQGPERHGPADSVTSDEWPSGPDQFPTAVGYGESLDAQRSTAAVGAAAGQLAPGGFTVVEAADERTLEMGSAVTNGIDREAPPSPYRMRLVLSNVGASVESATMTDHAETIDGPARYELLTPLELPDGTKHRSLTIDNVNIDSVDLSLHDKKWQVESIQPYRGESGEQGETVEFYIDVEQDGEPALRLTRTFTLPQQAMESGRHDLHSNLTIHNLSDSPHSVIITYSGGVGVKRVDPRIDQRSVDCGIYTGDRVEGMRKSFADVAKAAGGPTTVYQTTAGDSTARLTWVAAGNIYFTCTVAPLNRHDNSDNASYLRQVAAVDLDGSQSTDGDTVVRLVTRKEAISSGETLAYPADIYLGEKEADSFREVDDYARRNYYYQIAQGFGWCTFTWLVELMIWLLNSLHSIFGDYGVAIIILVLIVRALLHPITKKGQVNMVRMQQKMQELQPKIEEIKKKYANDKARLNQEMMKLNINPAGQMITCLPMVIQMPIWIALYVSLSNNILMRHEPAFWITWVQDLTAPDALYTFKTPIHVPLFGWELPHFNLLPILLSISMYIQMKLQPKPKPSPTMSDQQRAQQETMQKMGPMMSVMMLFIFYKMPSGLNLYIMASSLFGAVEQWRIRKHIKEHEAAGTLHKRPDKEKDGGDGRTRSGKPSFVQKLQKMAEEAQRVQSKRPTKARKRR